MFNGLHIYGCLSWKNDARAFQKSSLFDSGLAQCGMGESHLISDGVYPLKHWLMTPYRDMGNLTAQQLMYKSLATKRGVIERAFGMVKCRFHRLLKGIDMMDPDEIEQIILPCCHLHNRSIRAGDT